MLFSPKKKSQGWIRRNSKASGIRPRYLVEAWLEDFSDRVMSDPQEYRQIVKKKQQARTKGKK